MLGSLNNGKQKSQFDDAGFDPLLRIFSQPTLASKSRRDGPRHGRAYAEVDYIGKPPVAGRLHYIGESLMLILAVGTRWR